MSLADKAEGRIISQVLEIRLEPTRPVEVLGETDAAMEIGRGLITEAMRVLQAAAEGEGFKVTFHLRQVVY